VGLRPGHRGSIIEIKTLIFNAMEAGFRFTQGPSQRWWEFVG
jgi:hypothetical protein